MAPIPPAELVAALPVAWRVRVLLEALRGARVAESGATPGVAGYVGVDGAAAGRRAP